MVNGLNQTSVEKKGPPHRCSTSYFTDELHLRRTIDKIVSRIGRRVNKSSPWWTHASRRVARHAVIPPLAIDGSALAIRKFSADPLTAGDLVAFGSFTSAPPTSWTRAWPAQHRRLGLHRARERPPP